MKTKFYPIILLFCLAILACSNPRKIMEKGDYDDAVTHAVERLVGKKKKNDKHVRTLEEAFNKANAEDLAQMQALKNSNHDDKWIRIHSVIERIESRQNKITPLLPLVSKDGYWAEFDLFNTHEPKNTAAKNAADFLYADAHNLIRESERRKTKSPARRAYDQLARIDYFVRGYIDYNDLQDRAEELGHEYWILNVEEPRGLILPREFKTRLLEINTAPLQSFWRTYHTTYDSDRRYDYEANLQIQNLDVSPERINERELVEEKSVDDGWDYVLDGNGNVRKDSLGNDVKIKREKIIRAILLETNQSKFVRMDGNVVLFDLTQNVQVDMHRVDVEVIFDNYASRLLEGDRKALSKDSRRHLGGRMIPFPSDSDMILDAADLLKDKIIRAIRSS